MRQTIAVLIVAIFLLPVMGSASPGQCVDDGNNDASTAQAIGFNETVSEVVCPAMDIFDYYKFDVAPGADVSGTVSFDTDQTGTTVRVSGPGGMLVDWGSTDTNLSGVYTIPATGLTDGTYYIRVGFYSNYTYDHDYTLTMNITVDVPPGGGNEPFVPLKELLVGDLKAEYFPLKFAPWPCLAANPGNTNKSMNAGPSKGASLLREFNIREDVNADADGQFHSYKGLLIGPDDRAYFSDPGSDTLYAYSLQTGYLWDFPVRYAFDQPTYSLDKFGNVYAIHMDGVRLYKFDPDGNELWSRRIKGADGYSTALWPVGERVYVSDYDPPGQWDFGEHACFIHAWTLGGDTVLSEFEIEDVLFDFCGIAQDKGGTAYIHTSDYLYKYDPYGDEVWDRYFSYGSEHPSHLSPVITSTSKIFVDLKSRKKYIVFSSEGIYLKQWERDSNASGKRDICLGENGRLYACEQTSDIVCYDNWSEEAWRTHSPSGEIISEIILDKDEYLYAVYYKVGVGFNRTYHWMALDPQDGRILVDIAMNVPQPGNMVDPWGHLAIGDDGTLVYLNEIGYLAVYEPALTAIAPEIKIDRRMILEGSG